MYEKCSLFNQLTFLKNLKKVILTISTFFNFQAMTEIEAMHFFAKIFELFCDEKMHNVELPQS